MTFSTIHTLYGLKRMAAAEAANAALNITHMAVGDGAGNDYEPNEEQTQLRGEKFRAVVNRVFQDPVNPLQYTAELVIPASVGGFTLREVAAFDSDLGMFVVGNLPTSYKPDITEGAYGDSVVRIDFLVTNATVITLQVDPNVVVATRTWITNYVTAGMLMPGGTTGQVWAKRTNDDGDGHWVDPNVANVVVDVIEERQTLAANQTAVTMHITTTRGLAVYVGGARINKGAGVDGWTIANGGISQTDIILGKSYPDGTRILLTQNDPNGSAVAALERNLNLSDLENKATARANLGVYSKAEVDQKTPVGAVMYFPFTVAPSGWLKVNGANVSRIAFADLFAAIGTTYGDGDGFITFTLPDLRGEFIRCWDDQRGVDGGRGIGTIQTDQNKSHSHTATTSNSGSHSHSYVDTDTVTGFNGLAAGPNYNISDRETTRTTGTAGSHSHTVDVTSSGGTETRPRNIALLACIKF
jgi:phage-related tail fiber protein